MRDKTALLLASFAVLVGCAPPQPDAVRGIESTAAYLKTTNGWVTGAIEGTTRVFRGIPFARPPVGALRWSRPQPPLSWTSALDASTFKPNCIGLGSSANGSEDCLYLNVYAPASSRGYLPIMVWFHGGGNVANTAEREAHALANQGVIVVTVAYRLGVLGFLGHPALTTEQYGISGNYGFYDMIAGLRWVHDNAYQLGGDNQRVMIFGQSAGASDVNAILASPLARGLYQRAGMESDVLDHGQSLTLAQGEQLGSTLATAVGCAGTAAQQLTCLRGKSASELIQAPVTANEPIVDGYFLTSDPTTLLEGVGVPVPLLLGSTRDEWSEMHSPTETLAASDFAATVDGEYPLPGPTQIDELYPLSQYPSPLRAQIDVESDANVTCPVRRFASNVMRARFPQRIYRYLWTHTLANPTTYGAFLGAYHCAESSFIFGEWNYREAGGLAPTGYVPTAAEQALEATVQGYWVRFAASGDPNGGNAPFWSPYTGNYLTSTVQYLDGEITSGPDWHAAACDLLAP